MAAALVGEVVVEVSPFRLPRLTLGMVMRNGDSMVGVKVVSE